MAGERSVLYLHNAKAAFAPNSVVAAFRALGLRVAVLDGKADALPTHLSFAGVYLSGSGHGVQERLPWMLAQESFLRACVAAGVPLLGVCFGSQIIASALCGEDSVFRRDRCEVGYLPLWPTDEAAGDPLAGGWKPGEPMLVWHNDEVTHRHPDMRILAASDQCPNQIWRYRDRPVWGVQGHPDITPEEAPRWIGANAATFRADGADPQRLIARAAGCAWGPAIISRFAALCAASHQESGRGHDTAACRV